MKSLCDPKIIIHLFICSLISAIGHKCSFSVNLHGVLLDRERISTGNNYYLITILDQIKTEINHHPKGGAQLNPQYIDK